MLHCGRRHLAVEWGLPLTTARTVGVDSQDAGWDRVSGWEIPERRAASRVEEFLLT